MDSVSAKVTAGCFAVITSPSFLIFMVITTILMWRSDIYRLLLSIFLSVVVVPVCVSWAKKKRDEAARVAVEQTGRAKDFATKQVEQAKDLVETRTREITETMEKGLNALEQVSEGAKKAVSSLKEEAHQRRCDMEEAVEKGLEKRFGTKKRSLLARLYRRNGLFLFSYGVWKMIRWYTYALAVVAFIVMWRRFLTPKIYVKGLEGGAGGKARLNEIPRRVQESFEEQVELSVAEQLQRKNPPLEPYLLPEEARPYISKLDDIAFYAQLIGVPRPNKDRFVLRYQQLEWRIYQKELRPKALELFRKFKGNILVPGEAPLAGEEEMESIDDILLQIDQRGDRIRQRQLTRQERTLRKKRIRKARTYLESWLRSKRRQQDEPAIYDLSLEGGSGGGQQQEKGTAGDQNVEEPGAAVAPKIGLKLGASEYGQDNVAATKEAGVSLSGAAPGILQRATPFKLGTEFVRASVKKAVEAKEQLIEMAKHTSFIENADTSLEAVKSSEAAIAAFEKGLYKLPSAAEVEAISLRKFFDLAPDANVEAFVKTTMKETAEKAEKEATAKACEELAKKNLLFRVGSGVGVTFVAPYVWSFGKTSWYTARGKNKEVSEAEGAFAKTKAFARTTYKDAPPVVETAVGSIGSFGGAKAGAFLGLYFGPLGGILGGIAGGVLGQKFTSNLSKVSIWPKPIKVDEAVVDVPRLRASAIEKVPNSRRILRGKQRRPSGTSYGASISVSDCLSVDVSRAERQPMLNISVV